MCSCNEGVGLLGVVSPGWWEMLGVSVVTSKSVNSRLDEDKSELAVPVGSELLNVLSDVDSLLDKMIEVLWEGWSHTLNLEDSQDLGASDTLNLRDSVLISENDTDLGW